MLQLTSIEASIGGSRILRGVTLEIPDKNVVWKTELPFGHSSPALTRERIFLTAARGEKLVTICLDRRSGKILWEREYEGGCDRMAIAPDGKVIYVPSFEKAHWNVIDAIDGVDDPDLRQPG